MEIYVVGGGILAANAYLIAEHAGAPGVLIDAGCGIPSLTKEVEKHTDGIAAVLLTHGHFDHIMALEKIKEIYNPKIYIHENDADMLMDASENMSDRFIRKPLNLDKADVKFKDGDEIGVAGLNFKVFHTPGHTMGSSIFMIDSYAFSGDTLFKGSIGRFDFPHSDFESLVSSLERIKKEIPKETIIYPGHGKKTTMAEELAKNPHLQFYQTI